MAAQGAKDGLNGRIIGVVCSRNFSRTGDMGYGFVVSEGKILGAKKPEDLDEFEAYFAEDSQASADAGKTKQVAGVLRAHKEFEVDIGRIGQALIRIPSSLRGGYLILKLPMRSIGIDIAVVSTQSPFIAETSMKLARMMFDAVGARLYDGITGDAVETVQQLETLRAHHPLL